MTDESCLPSTTPSSYVKSPFTRHLKPEEPLLWIGRPDEEVFMKRTWQEFKRICISGCAFALFCLVVMVYAPGTSLRYLTAFALLMTFVALGFILRSIPDSYRYAPWYALTGRHLLVALLDEGSFIVRKTELSTITSIEIVGMNSNADINTGREIGSVVCTRKVGFLTIVSSRKIKLALIEQPKQLELLPRSLMATS